MRVMAVGTGSPGKTEKSQTQLAKRHYGEADLDQFRITVGIIASSTKTEQHASLSLFFFLFFFFLSF